MQINIALLAKKAIDSALKGEWQAAIEFNKEILEKDPKNIDAKLRLGRAYIQKKDFKDAEKLFEDVLKLDPINQIALKNLKIAKSRKSDFSNSPNVDAKTLIKEPGTTVEANLLVSTKNMDCEDFLTGEILKLKVRKHAADVIKTRARGEVLVGEITDKDLVTRLNVAQNKKAHITVSYIKGSGKKIFVLIKSDVSVFKAERQDVKPYLKKGSIEEPELEIESELAFENQ